MEQSCEWVLKIIESCTDRFHWECCRVLCGLFIVQYGASEWSVKLIDTLNKKGKEIDASENDE